MARLTLRLDFGPGRAIGHGKIRLLEAVRENGSISAAGRSMGMSYRRAWLLIDELNHIFEEPVHRRQARRFRRRWRRANAVWPSCRLAVSRH
jgi:molybdate transport system regulatory protein